MFENHTISLNVLCNSCAKIVCCLSWTSLPFMRAAGSKTWASNSSYASTFFSKTRSSSHHTNNILTQQGRWGEGGGSLHTRFTKQNFGNHSKLGACLWSVFLQRQILSPPRILTIPSESPCVFLQHLLLICFIVVVISLHSKCRPVNICSEILPLILP